MKVAYVELAGFRGFRDKTRFDFSPSFVVLSGRNGAGKSTILDALDFALTGTIDKYPVTSAKGGGLNSHMWWLGGAPSDNNTSNLASSMMMVAPTPSAAHRTGRSSLPLTSLNSCA